MDDQTTSTPTTTIGNAAASLALADSSPATPEATPQTETPAPTATTSAAAEPQAPESASTESKGEPPKWRWQDILQNARETTAKETEARIRQEFDGLRDFAGLDANQRAGLVIWNRALSGDPQALATIKANPMAMQALQGMFAPSAPAVDAEPVVIGRNPDGTEYFDPDAFERWKVWNARQTDLRVEAKLRPFQQVAQTFQQREAQGQAQQEASAALAAFANDPDFTPEHRKACAEEIGKDPRLSALADRDPQAALEIAWNRVYRTKVLPQRDSKNEEKVLANLQQRAVAGTTNPGAASTSAPPNMIGDARAALKYAESVVGAT